MGSANLNQFRTVDPYPGEMIMQAKDIKPRAWYATKEKYAYPDAIMVDSTDRYTIEGRHSYTGDDERVIFASPDRSMGGGRRSWHSDRTAYLGVKLTNDAKATVQNWILHDQDEDAAHAIMHEAAELLTKVVAAIAERGKVPMIEISQPENRAKGIHIVLVEGREIVADYAELIKTKYTREQEGKRAREAAEDATEKRRQRLIDLITEAREMGLNTDSSKGGVQDNYSAYSKYSEVRMSVENYAALVAEIARLRRVVAGTLRADEVGEGGGDA